MKFPCLILLILIFSFSLFAQNTLSGRIINSDKHEAINAVFVYLPEINKATVSDSGGTYHIENIPLGKYKIQFSHIGYKTLIKTIQINMTAISFDVMLISSPFEADEIVVTAPTYSSPDETAYNVVAINPDDERKNGSVTLTETIAKLPGFSELTTGPGIAKPVIRGLYGNRILTTINGFRFDNQQWQDEHGLGLSDIGVGKIEIIKGPAALLYGSDAQGGVINLLDEKPAPYGQTSGDYSLKMFSNTYGVASDIGLRGTGEKYNWKVRLGGQSHADYHDGKDERVPNTRFNGLDLKAGFGYADKNRVLKVNYHFSLYQFGVVEQEELENGKKEKPWERGLERPHHTVNYHLLTTQNTFFWGNTQFELDAGIHLNNRAETEGGEEAQSVAGIGELDMQLNTYSFNPKIYVPLSENSQFIGGVQSNYQTNKNDGERVIIPDATNSEISAFVFMKHSFNNLVIEEGASFGSFKIDTKEHGTYGQAGYMPRLSKNYNFSSGSVGFALHLNKYLLLKSNLSSGYRAPNLAELSSNGLHEGTLNYEIGDATLKNEHNIEIDFDTRYETSAATLYADLFYNVIKNFIYLSPTNETIDAYNVYRFLQDDAYIRGFEVGLEWALSFWQRAIVRSRYSALVGKRSDGKFLPFMPANRINGELRINDLLPGLLNNGYMKIVVNSVLAQNNLSVGELATPSYTLGNIAFGSSLSVLGVCANVTLGCKNLFNKVYFDHLSRIKPGRFNDPDVGFKNIGRNIYLNIGFPFEVN